MQILRGLAARRRVAELAARSSSLSRHEASVQRIVTNVRRRGDVALRSYARKWDKLGNQSLRVSREEMGRAPTSPSKELRTAIKIASANIRDFAERQKAHEWKYSRNGVSVGQIVRPLESVGCYVPGGRHPLLSTLLMTVIPAQVAGVRRICVASPQPAPELLAVAYELGVDEFYRVGGAQAIAAFAYGTPSVPRVDKIVGPGNAYVTAAKKLVAFDCAIDMLAGPTEVVVVSHDGNPEWIASDLVTQSEHDPDAIAILITLSKELAARCVDAAAQQAANNPVAKESWRANGCALIARNRTEAMAWANVIAPEHITVPAEDVDAVQNAGSIFVGDYSPQAGGDYATGPNHVLPTGGAARFRGGLTVLDFVKLITVQRCSSAGLRKLSATITTLADFEGLVAHADSVRMRCGNA